MKYNKSLGTFPAIYTVLPVAVSVGRTLGSATQALIKVMVAERADFQDDIQSSRKRMAVESRNIAHLRRHFSFGLQNTFSQHTKHHFCRHGVICMETVKTPARPEAAEASSRQTS